MIVLQRQDTLGRYIVLNLGEEFLRNCLILCDPMNCNRPGSSVLHYLPWFAQIHVHYVGDAFNPFYPFPPPPHFGFNLSENQGLFQGVGSLYQVTNTLEPCFSISPSNELSGLIFLRIDCLDHFVFKWTLKNRLQHHNSKTSGLQPSLRSNSHIHK